MYLFSNGPPPACVLPNVTFARVDEFANGLAVHFRVIFFGLPTQRKLINVSAGRYSDRLAFAFFEHSRCGL